MLKLQDRLEDLTPMDGLADSSHAGEGPHDPPRLLTLAFQSPSGVILGKANVSEAFTGVQLKQLIAAQSDFDAELALSVHRQIQTELAKDASSAATLERPKEAMGKIQAPDQEDSVDSRPLRETLKALQVAQNALAAEASSKVHASQLLQSSLQGAAVAVEALKRGKEEQTATWLRDAGRGLQWMQDRWSQHTDSETKVGQLLENASNIAAKALMYCAGAMFFMIMLGQMNQCVSEASSGGEHLFTGSSFLRGLVVIIALTWIPFPIWYALSPEGFNIIQDAAGMKVAVAFLNVFSKGSFMMYLARIRTDHQTRQKTLVAVGYIEEMDGVTKREKDGSNQYTPKENDIDNKNYNL